MTNPVLLDLKDQVITTKEAYDELYKPKKVKKPRKAHFVKVKVRIPDDRAANRLLAFFLFLPFPLFIVRIGLRFVKNEDDLPLPKSEIFELISYRGIKVSVNAKGGEKVYIKTF
ncbi:MAG: hypothetical protein AB7U79_02945 [Candidatus Izemoplasmatales bacterium]